MKTYEVVAAIIEYQDTFLCMQRDKGKYDYVSFKYEFPGGKIEPGESHPQALMRELKEEMDMNIEIKEEDFLISLSHQYPDFIINMYGYKCRVQNQLFKLKEHINFQWLPKEKLKELDWAAADIPIVEKLIGEK